MGGHIAAAAVDAETQETANNKVRYDGSVPMCGVLGDTELYNYFGASQIAAQQLAGMPVTTLARPANWANRALKVRSAPFTTFPTATTPSGRPVQGNRQSNSQAASGPCSTRGFAGSMNARRYGARSDAMARSTASSTARGYDTTGIVYQFDNDPALTATEQSFNQTAYRLRADPEANRLRRDGLRWFPKTNARINVRRW